jgi:hypothetical protein
MAQFLLECRRQIEHGTLDVAQLQELWRIFAPAGDWDKVVGDVEMGNEIFALLSRPCSVGGPVIVSGLKTVLQTGRPTPKFELPDMPTD